MGSRGRDHRTDMRHILHHLRPAAALPPDAPDPLMLDVDLSAIVLRLPGPDTTTTTTTTTITIPFTPPLQTWDARRARLVEMTRAARDALGVPDVAAPAKPVVVVVDEYMPPRWPYDAAVFLAVLGYHAAFVVLRLGGFAAGGLAARAVEGVGFPGGVGGFRWLVETIFVPVLGIHVAETWWLERTRLREFGVARGSRVWWLWVGSVFVEGAMAFKRFDLVVERLRAEKAEKGSG
ncbi:hypothetical protein BT67DRAFT_479253 [Trichocladium antarcticum]|uniref:DUF2470 domain-containing protein n=1 Tax=Trichocladium antarcticum TaxID=1450529 RepID=A0AAN6UI29_9PEZI|nr:hypothetical protein BT67DRAFT_479253 [Trichocladium antarcticum]